MTFDPATHGVTCCTVPLNPYPRPSSAEELRGTPQAHSAAAAMLLFPALTAEDREQQRLLDEANERRTQVIADARQEYADNRDVIQEKFPGMTLAKWIDSALQGENLPLLDAAERDKLGGWMG